MDPGFPMGEGVHGQRWHPDQGVTLFGGKTCQVGAISYREGADIRFQ